MARSSSWLACVHAIAADGGDPRSCADRSRQVSVLRGSRRAAGRDGFRNAGHCRRCFPHREPAGKRTGRRHGILRRGVPRWYGRLDGRSAVSGHWLRSRRSRPSPGLDGELCRDGRSGGDRHRYRAAGEGTVLVTSCGRRERCQAFAEARGAGGDDGVHGLSLAT